MKTKTNQIQNLVIQIVVGLTSLIGLISYHPSSVMAAQGPSITWSQPQLTVTLAPGAAVNMDLTFTSSVGRQGITVEAVPEIARFLTLQPNTFPNVPAGQVQTVQLFFGIPSSTAIGIYQGTIHVRSGNATLPQTLKVAITVQGTSGGPTISSISPGSGGLSSPVLIRGSNLAGANPAATLVTFAPGITAQIVESVGSNEIIAVVPFGAVTGAVSVTVEGQKSNEVNFTVIADFGPIVDPKFMVTTQAGETFSINQILVRLKVGSGISDAQVLAPTIGATVVGYLPPFNIFVFEINPPPTSISELEGKIAQIQTDTRVLGVLKNVAGKPSSVRTDIGQIQNRSIVWAYDRVRTQRAWNLLEGKLLAPVNIAVIDGGFGNPPHCEFQNLTGGGSVRSIRVGIAPQVPVDPEHGTAVAGIISANNDPDTAKACDPLEGDINGILSGANVPFTLSVYQIGDFYLIQNAFQAIIRAATDGARVVNMSFGYDPSQGHPLAQLDQMRTAFADGLSRYPNILFVSAAGNQGEDIATFPTVPANVHGDIAVGNAKKSIMNNITVGGTDFEDNRSRDYHAPDIASNFGFDVDISAPSSKVLTLLLTATEEGQDLFFGTSFAAPQVAATAALLLSINRNLSVVEIRTMLLNGAALIKTDRPIGNTGLAPLPDGSWGSYRLNVCRSVAIALGQDRDKSCGGDVFTTSTDYAYNPPTNEFFVDSVKGVTSWTLLGPLGTVPNGYNSSEPVISPGATHFARFETSPATGTYLVIRDLSSGVVIKTVRLDGFNPHWLPDGRIFYQGSPGCSFNTFQWETETTTRIADYFCGVYPHPVFSSDGAQIVYNTFTNVAGPPFQVETPYIINTTPGAVPHPLLAPRQPCTVDGKFIPKCVLDSVRTGYQMSWAPDGSKIALGGQLLLDTNNDGFFDSFPLGLFVIEMGTGRITTLVKVDDHFVNPDQGFVCCSLFFSPDGEWVLYNAGFSGEQSRLKVVSPSGGPSLDLGTGHLIGSLNDTPKSPWSPNSLSILFEDNSVLYSQSINSSFRIPLSPSSLFLCLDAQWVAK